MAHNAEDLSWGGLLRQIPELNGARPQDPRFEPIDDPESNVATFTEDFIIRLMRDVREERAKYPSESDLESPQQGEILMDEATIKEMEPIVRRFGMDALIVNDCCPHDDDQNPSTAHVGRRFDDNLVRKDPISSIEQEQLPISNEYAKGTPSFKICDHDSSPRCACVIPRRNLTTEAFISRPSTSQVPQGNRSYNMQLLCALVWHGKLETPIRLCHHPGFGWWLWHICQGDHGGLIFDGFKTWVHLTLEAYLCLNLLLHGQSSSTLRLTATDDYRETYCYQSMLEDTTGRMIDQHFEKPWHRSFFGVGSAGPFGKWDQTGTHVTHQLLHGMENSHEFEPVERRQVLQRTGQDVDEVMGILAARGLPAELILPIIDLADYWPTTMFSVLDDPLHEQNREALQKYLDQCWKLLVGFEIMAQEMPPIDPNRFGSRLNWFLHIKSAVRRLQGGGDQALLLQRQTSEFALEDASG